MLVPRRVYQFLDMFKSAKVLLRLVTGGAGGKGLGAFKQFRPSLDLVSAELLTRAAKMVPQRQISSLVGG